MKLAEKTSEIESLREEIQKIKEGNAAHNRRYDELARTNATTKVEMEAAKAAMEAHKRLMEDFMVEYRVSR